MMGEKLGMIGLGKMGLPLSLQLMSDGHAVCGYDIDPERMKLLKDAGGSTTASAQEVAEQSDITFSILLKPEHIEENTLGPNGIVQAAKTGASAVTTAAARTPVPMLSQNIVES